MKSKSSDKFKIRYSKKNKKSGVLIEGRYSDKHHWTIMLDNISDLKELGNLITDIREELIFG